LVAGVDDAGRGSVVGPLVIAGILVSNDRLEELQKIGVKDSKLLTSNQRLKLVDQVKRIAVKHSFVEVSPVEIDSVVTKGKKLFKLNFLEAKTMAQVIERLKPDTAYIDASDTLADRFGKQVKSMVSFKVRIVSEHGADKKYVVVGAASILAKVRRDDAIARLSRMYGDIGSGYPNDQKTLNFLRGWLREHITYPDFVRKSWGTAKRIRLEVLGSQERLETHLL